jgi:antiviral helicase SLH1
MAVKGKARKPAVKDEPRPRDFREGFCARSEGHQVMVFVHARKETVKAALALREAASKEDMSDMNSVVKTIRASVTSAVKLALPETRR